jgi:hypothetical protein
MITMSTLIYRDTDLLSIPLIPPTTEELHCYHCPNLLSIPPLPPTLKLIQLYDCPNLHSLPLLPPTLQCILCTDCPNLSLNSPLPPSIQKLWCVDCPNISSIFPLPRGLQKLCCCNCKYLYIPERVKRRFFIRRTDFTINYSTKARKIQKCYSEYKQRKFHQMLYDNSTLPNDVCFCLSKFV